MSVTVSDLLKLPSLKPARVLAGAGGLSRTVAYVSVLEYANPQILEDDLFPGDTYSGSEIVITGFMNNPADERLQCAVVRRLAEAGEVGLILYYVGVFLPRVDRKLLELADELDYAFFNRDADNVEASDAVVLFGMEEVRRGLDAGCQYCHFESCADCTEKDGLCAWDAIDIGIAIGSAAAAAADARVDSRVMFSVGRTAKSLGLLGEKASLVLGLPLSISGKSPFFDRKPKK